jgi:hypothetical protein
VSRTNKPTEPEMNIAKRVAKLEHAEIFVSARPLSTRLEAALNAAALRITGKPLDAVSGDEVATRLICDDLQERFVRELSLTDLESLIAELQQVAFKGDTAARDAEQGMPISEDKAERVGVPA